MEAELLRHMIDRYTNANFTINRRMHAMIRHLMPDSLTADQYLTLNYIHKRGSCTSTELADNFMVGKSAITAIITRLADKQLIARVPDDRDRRVTYLRLTAEGKAVTDEIDANMAAYLSKVLVQFAEQEAETFMQTYEKLADVLVQIDFGGESNK